MASFGSFVYNALSYAIHYLYTTIAYILLRAQPQLVAIDDPSEKTWMPCIPYSSDRYQPSIEDVLVLKEVLMKKSGLPLELVDGIIDLAEYWPHISTTKPGPVTSVRSGGDHENQFLVRSYPLGMFPDWEDHSTYQITDQYEGKFPTLLPRPWAEKRESTESATKEVLKAWKERSKSRGEFPCRKIIFTIVSHDQGWGGGAASRGGYDGSYTWFDVGKEEFSAFREPSLEARELAPWPQFQLYSANKDENQPPSTSSTRALVCSLRTVSPPTIITGTPEDGDEESKFSHALLPSDECLQKNLTAERRPKQHTITWTYTDMCREPENGDALDEGRGRKSKNGDYVRSLKTGDTITVWGKARFPGWVNVVEEVKIDVYWAV